jgi:hypothetical protein
MKSLFNYVKTFKTTLNDLPQLDVECVDVLVGCSEGDLYTLEIFFKDGEELIVIELEYDYVDLEENCEEGLTQQVVSDIIYAVSLEQLNFKTLH